MDERDTRLTGDRPPASRSTIVARRVVAIGALVAVLAAAGVVGAAVLRKNDSPPTPTTTVPPLARLHVIFPEGFTVQEMADRIGAVRGIAIARRNVTPRLTQAGYEAAARRAIPPPEFRKDARGKPIEGFLFPATYEFSQYTPSARLVGDQLRAFRKSWRAVDLRYARSKNLTPYDVLIIASMVEKEAVAPTERPLVAAVIYNRLHNRMPLGIDATIRYGRNVPGTEPLKQSDLESDSPYNTRKRLGLPPTPIANPGLASMKAAAHPAKVDYLYFVRKPDKVHHFFTASQADFCAKSLAYGYGGC